MKRVVIAVSITAVGLVGVAIGYRWAHYKDPNLPGRMGIVNVNMIRSDIDEMLYIDKAAEVRESGIRRSVHVLSHKVQAELTKQAEEIGDRPKPKGDTPTAAEQKLIDEWVAKMEKLERARLEAAGKIRQNLQQQCRANQQAFEAKDKKIRDWIRPVAQRIATEKGLDIVMPASSAFVHDEAVDITAEVLKEVRKLVKAGSFPP